MKRITAIDLKYAGRPRSALPAWFSDYSLAGARKRFAHGRKKQVVSHFVAAGEIVVCLSVMKMPEEGCVFRVHRRLSGIHISLQGSLDCSWADRRIQVPEHTISFFDLQTSDFTAVPPQGGYAGLDVFYPPEIIRRYRHITAIPDEADLHALFQPAGAAVLDIVHRIQTCPYTGKTAKTYLQLLCSELLLALCALCNRQLSKKGSVTQSITARMQGVRSFIDSHVTTHFTIEELSKRFAINTTTLKNHFHAATGTGLYAYLLSKRMVRAQDLLATRDLTIAEIAYQVGYKSPGAFIRAHKKFYGFTPAQKRNV